MYLISTHILLQLDISIFVLFCSPNNYTERSSAANRLIGEVVQSRRRRPLLGPSPWLYNFTDGSFHSTSPRQQLVDTTLCYVAALTTAASGLECAWWTRWGWRWSGGRTGPAAGWAEASPRRSGLWPRSRRVGQRTSFVTVAMELFVYRRRGEVVCAVPQRVWDQADWCRAHRHLRLPRAAAQPPEGTQTRGHQARHTLDLKSRYLLL